MYRRLTARRTAYKLCASLPLKSSLRVSSRGGVREGVRLGQVTVLWCIIYYERVHTKSAKHSEECRNNDIILLLRPAPAVRSSPSVFVSGKRPWIASDSSHKTHHNLIRPTQYYIRLRHVDLCIARARVCFFLLSSSLKITRVRLLIARQNTCNFTFSGRFVGDKTTTTTTTTRGASNV